jgi:D-alanine-D-alanine ligase
MKKIKVGVIFGGRSGEHEVSLVSAHSILQAIDRDKYEVVPIGITSEGRWVVGADVVQALKIGDMTRLKPATFHTDPTQNGLLAMDRDHRALSTEGEQVSLMLEHLDVVFPVLHGPNGEDGTIQGLFEMADIPYVGSGVFASAAAMDKALSKALWARAGLPMVPHQTFLRSEWEKHPEKITATAKATFALPVFVKPANLGSSVGICKVKTWEDLAKAIDLACRFDRKVLIEQGVDAREIELGVLGNEADLTVSVPGEVLVAGEFYDFYDKYVNGASTTQIPAANLSPEKVKEFQALARRAFETLDCSGLARVDFFLERKTDKIYLNEINTIPGFTSISMYPKLMGTAGIPYPELIDRLLQLALERHRDKQRNQIQFNSESDWFLK